MTKIKTIFLDMDGVITDFIGGVCRVFNKPYPYPEVTKDYTFWDAWPDVSFKDVDAVCTQEFWHNLEWERDGQDIFKAVLDKIRLEDIYFVTQPMPNIESPTGKWMWVRDNFPGFLTHVIITQAPKGLLAQSSALLIDDKDENVIEFRKAGGNAILVPRPYNKLRKYSDVSSQIVRKELEQYEAIRC